MIQLLNRFDQTKVIHEGNYRDKRELVEYCAKNGISMQYADLQYADLRGVDLIGADLRDAVLYNANLFSANLSKTNFRNSDLRYANLTASILSCADLTKSDLTGVNLAYTDLTNANLRVVDFRYANLTNAKIDYQIEDGLLEKIAEIVIESPKKLNMGYWHSGCGTVHCIAGWAVELSENGKKLEEKFGTEIAGLLLLGNDAHYHFYDSNRDALEYLRSVLNK